MNDEAKLPCSESLITQSRLWLLFLLTTLSFLGLFYWLVSAANPVSHGLGQGYWLQPDKPLADFTLNTHKGQAFNRTNLLGSWHILVYGYTYCPDICPTTLLTMSALSKRIHNLAHLKTTGFIFYTVDPLRDTESRLSDYVHFFEKEFDNGLVGLRASDTDQQLKFEHMLGIKSSIEIKDINSQDVEIGDSKDHYNVSHGMTLYVINPKAELSAVLLPTTNPLGVSHFDLETLYQDLKLINDSSLFRQ
ncbi:SCO family protein [Shewanella cyperi]|uniref:SCO family protein n=1 Tax=Shewanella cyperi TaxID=2814292 RepID=A0A974XNH3_9GAMM|nr:SCO family protein [Shewanella cyperi]QSX31670.1 SCO family protein [Shewanella cyperi]